MFTRGYKLKLITVCLFVFCPIKSFITIDNKRFIIFFLYLIILVLFLHDFITYIIAVFIIFFIFAAHSL